MSLSQWCPPRACLRDVCQLRFSLWARAAGAIALVVHPGGLNGAEEMCDESGDVVIAMPGHHLKAEAGVAFRHGREFDHIGDDAPSWQLTADQSSECLIADDDGDDGR